MATTYLSRTNGSPTLGTKYTFSFWMKRCITGFDHRLFNNFIDGSNAGQIYIDASNDRLNIVDTNGGSTHLNLTTTRRFRDTNSFYHIVIAADTTQSTAASRLKIYINGTQIISANNGFASETYPSQDAILKMNAAAASGQTRIGSHNGGGDYFDGYMTHIHFIDGTAYAASTFGETDSTSGIWIPKTAPSVTYGNNGYFLKFENSGAMGTDSSGNSNTFAVSGTLTQSIDTPDNNFAVLNPLPSQEINSSAFYEYGGTNCRSSTANFIAGVSGIYLDKGKWYFEMQTATADSHIGIAGEDKIMNGGTSGGVNNRLFYYEDTTGYAYSYYGTNGQIYFSTTSDGTQTASYGNTFSSSDTIGCFADLDNNKLYFSKNGTIQNSGTGYDIQDNILYAFGTSVYQSDASLNFGNGTFKGVKLTGTTYSDANGEGIFKYSPNQGGASNFDSSAKNFYTLNTKNIKEFG